MTRRLAAVAASALAATAIGPAIAGCQLFPVQHQAGGQISGITGRPSVLTIVLNPRAASARDRFRRLVTGTARAGEHLIVLSAWGATLGSFTAPRPPRTRGPALPRPPQPGATSYQRAAYRKTLAQVRAQLRGDRARMRAVQHRDLSSWAIAAVATVLRAARRSGNPKSGSELAIHDAVSDIDSLSQTGLRTSGRAVLALLGMPARDTPPHLRFSLAGLTIIVADVQSPAVQQTWQAELAEARAGGVYVLTPGTAGRLNYLVASHLAGQATALNYPVIGLHYGQDQFTVGRGATASLRTLLRLLAVTYPGASATINGYTDDVRVRGGNVALSWKRAMAVMTWLINHGIAASRLQSAGHGSADPAAPNRPGGQPLNRRVIVVIDPAG